MTSIAPSSWRIFARPGLILALLTSILGGCATPQRVPLAADTPTPINGIVGLRQQEIGTTINRSNLTAVSGGGLLFALIDAGINNSRGKKAETAVAPIRDALVSYQPGAALTDALRRHFAERPQFAVSDVQVRQISDNTTIGRWIAESPAGTILLLDTTYELLPNFGGVRVKARISLHRPKAAKAAGVPRSGLPPTFYFNEFASTVHIEGWNGMQNRDGAVLLWTDNEGAAGRAALDRAFHEVVAMLAYDLDQPAPANNALYKQPEAEHRLTTAPNNDDLLTEGYIEKRDGERVWVRLLTGELVGLEA